MALITCFTCKEKIEKEVSESYLKEGQKTYKYFCSIEHKQAYIDKLDKEKLKQIETDKFNDLDIYIAAEILLYEIGQIVPPNLKKRVQKLHKNYSYEVIRLCFELMKPQLNGILNKKEFTDEQHMINYIMVVVENNINDAYRIWKRRNEIARKQESHSIDINLMQEIKEDKPVVKKQNKGIMDFLEEEDY